MPLSLRIPEEKEKLLKKAAKKAKKTKTAFILEAIDEKLGLKESSKDLARNLAGWMNHSETKKLRNSLNKFNSINPGDWE